AHGQLVLRVEQTGEREDDVLGAERLAVVEDGVVDQVEEYGPLVLLLPGLRQARNELPGLVRVDQLVVDVLVDLQRGVELGEARILVTGLAAGGPAGRAATLRRALREGRAVAAPRAEADPGGGAGRAGEPLPPRQAEASVHHVRVVAGLVTLAHRSC